MDDYIENSSLPEKIEQKYEWSCKICNIKTALNSLLKTNISEDDLLSKVMPIEVSDKYMEIIKQDAPWIKLVKTDIPMPIVVRYTNLEKTIKNICKENIIFKKYTCPELSIKETEAAQTILHKSDFENAVDNAQNEDINYYYLAEILQNNGIVIASGNRKRINKLTEDMLHSFIIKSIGKKDGQKLAKVLDSNYKRRNLEPAYFVPLEKLSIELIFR